MFLFFSNCKGRNEEVGEADISTAYSSRAEQVNEG